LILYFQLRKFFASKDPLKDISKAASFKAGVASFIVTMLFYAIAVHIDTSKIDNDLNSMMDNISINNLESSFINFNDSFNVDDPEKIKQSLTALEVARAELDNTENAIKKMITYFDGYKTAIDRTKLAPILKARELFQFSESYFILLREYLVESKKVLIFASNNYAKLNTGAKQERKLMEKLLENMESIENQLDEAEKRKIQKVKEFFQQNPDCVKVLSENSKKKLNL